MWDIAAVFVILCGLMLLLAPLVEGTTIEAEPAPEEEPHRIGVRCRRNGPNDGHEYRKNANGDLYCIREDCDEYITKVSA